MATRLTLEQAAQFLQAAQDVLILAHKSPDGDTLGSGFGLLHALRGMGKRVWLACSDPIPPRYAYLMGGLTDAVWEDGAGIVPQAVVAVDIADTKLFGEKLRGFADKVQLCIDHHGSNTGFARQTVVDPSRSAVGELIWELGEELHFSPTLAFCQGIYTAIATDTGCFRYPNTTPRCHTIAAACMENGLDCGPINKVFFETKTRARFQVEQYLFSHLQFSAGGKLAAALFPQEAIEEMGATADDLDNLASLPRQIEGVSCSITLTQLGAELFKASVRSDEQVDASALCAQFGGGGHARAAGCTLRGEGADCLQRLAAAAQEALGYV